MSEFVNKCPSRLVLDRFLHDEFRGTKEHASLENHLSSCAKCKDLAILVEGTYKEIAAGLDSEGYARTLLEKSRRGRRSQVSEHAPAARIWDWLASHRLSLASAFGVAVCAIIGVSLLSPPASKHRQAATELTSINGQTSFKVYCRRAGQVMELETEDRIFAGDALQFQLFTETHDYALVAGLQSTGEVEVYVPYAGKESAAIRRGTTAVLGNESVLINEGGGDLLLVALLTAKPVESSRVVAEIGRAYRAAGNDIHNLGQLQLPGATISRLLRRAR